MDVRRAAAWSKILLLGEIAPNYDVSIWVDDDIIITRPEKPLDDFLNEFNKSGALIAVQQDKYEQSDPVNCGFMLVKKNGVKMLQHIWNIAEGSNIMTARNWEQSAFVALWHNDSDFRKNVFRFPPRTIQSFYRIGDPPEYTWANGDFSAHCSCEPVVENMKYLHSGGRATYSQKISS